LFLKRVYLDILIISCDFETFVLYLRYVIIGMTIEQAFEHLLGNWKNQSTEFVTKYRSYKSKYLKSKGDKTSEPIGERKMKEMLEKAGYKIKTKVTPP
jgi:hypothetical protein